MHPARHTKRWLDQTSEGKDPRDKEQYAHRPHWGGGKEHI